MTRPVNITDYSDKKLVATTIADMWDQFNMSRVQAMELWKEVDLYRFATDTKSLPGGNNFDHAMHTPATHMIDEKLGSILNATAFPHEDWLGWKPLDVESSAVDKQKKVLGYLKKIHGVTKFTRTGKKSLDDLKAYGNTFLQTVFVNEQTTENGEVQAGYVGPKTFRISPYDIVFDPTAPSFDSSFKIVRQRMTVGEFALLAETYEEHMDAKEVERVLKRRSGAAEGAGSNDYFKDGQFVAQGFDSATAYYRSGYVELLWFYGSFFDETTLKVVPNRCIVVADFNTPIMDVYKKESRIRKGSWKERPDNLWAQSPLEPIIGLNYMINHRENAKNDAIDRMIYPDHIYVGEPEIIHDDVTGRREIWAPLNGDARDITPDASTLSYDGQIDRIEQTIMEAVGLPSDVLGFRSPGEKTAFEVQNLTEGAFRGFIDHVAQWEQDCLEKVVADQLAVAYENYTSVEKVLVEDEDGFLSTLEVTQDDLKANGTLLPMGARRFSRMLQQLAGIQSMSQTAQLFAQHIDTYNLAKAIEQLSGLDDYDIIRRFAAVQEQGEMQKEQAMVEQDVVNDMSQPSPLEMGMMDE